MDLPLDQPSDRKFLPDKAQYLLEFMGVRLVEADGHCEAMIPKADARLNLIIVGNERRSGVRSDLPVELFHSGRLRGVRKIPEFPDLPSKPPPRAVRSFIAR